MNQEELRKDALYKIYQYATSSIDGLPAIKESKFEALADDLAELEAEREKWISVTDSLPENRSNVLAYTTNGGYTTSCEYKHGCWFKGLDRLHFVTHWQPLPTPPKTSKK